VFKEGVDQKFGRNEQEEDREVEDGGKSGFFGSKQDLTTKGTIG
jgi:hypothetical protein